MTPQTSTCGTRTADSTLTRISAGDGGTGNVDGCVSTWTTSCDIKTYDDSTISTTLGNLGGLGSWFADSPNPGYTDNAIAAGNGDIYFYSPEQLEAKACPGKQNLYVYHDGEPQHVVTLEDESYCLPYLPSERASWLQYVLGRLQVTPNGHYAAFVTTTKLTPYDNQGYAEMYRYDAETRKIVCVSCTPDGSPPSSDCSAAKVGASSPTTAASSSTLRSRSIRATQIRPATCTSSSRVAAGDHYRYGRGP